MSWPPPAFTAASRSADLNGFCRLEMAPSLVAMVRKSGASPGSGESLGWLPQGDRTDARRAIDAGRGAADVWARLTAFERAAKISGSRFVVHFGAGARQQQRHFTAQAPTAERPRTTADLAAGTQKVVGLADLAREIERAHAAHHHG